MSADIEDQLEKEIENEDREEYYSLLNIPRTATQDEIRSAYRRVCRIYHPDRLATYIVVYFGFVISVTIFRYHDEDRQGIAGHFFRKVQEAYQILSDPRLRSVYDLRGKKGVTDDRAIIERTTLPTELMNEYEKLKALFEERTYIQDVNPTGLFEMKLDATPLFTGDSTRTPISFKGVHAQQYVDAKITKYNTLTLGGMVYANNTGYSSVAQLGTKQYLDKQNWIKVGTAIGFPNTINLDFYRHLTNRMYITSSNFLQIHSGFLVMSFNGQLAYKLDNRTTLVYKAKHNASSLGIQITRKVSEKVEVSGEVMVGYDSSYVEASCKFQPKTEYTLNGTLKLSTSGPSISYGVDHRFATLTNLRAIVSVSDTGVGLRLTIIRATMSFSFKFHLCPYPSLGAILVATVFPPVSIGCLKMLAYAPLLHKQKLQEMEEMKEERQKEMTERKKEAESAVDLMKETVERVMSVETARQGLVIIEAWYGCLFSTQPRDPLSPPKVIDVTIPLQCCVIDSKLILRESSKSMVIGFYDPCIGEKKHLRVRYEFHGDVHEVTIENSEPLVIPRQSHKLH